MLLQSSNLEGPDVGKVQDLRPVFSKILVVLSDSCAVCLCT